MKAAVTATAVTVSLSVSQRELELLHELFSHLTGFNAEEIAQVETSALEFTEILSTFSAATRAQVRNVTSRQGLERGLPKVETS